MLALPALPADRPQTFGEEVANAISHGIGFLLAVAAYPTLVGFATERGNPVHVVAINVFASTMMLLYFVSMLYHALPAGRTKLWLMRVDHAAIYLFIAGTYTPFALGVLRGPWDWSLFGFVWTLAALGAMAKLLNRLSHPLLSTALYVAMGWIAILAAGPLLRHMPPAGLNWLVAGGLAYTAGVIVFLFDSRFRYAHFAWHLFVLAGSTCHFFAALRYTA
jgi:hemolysin III